MHSSAHSIGLSLLASLALVSCMQSTRNSNADTTNRPAAAEGEFCGGIAGIPCGEGLGCAYDGDYPDAGGTCVKEW